MCSAYMDDDDDDDGADLERWRKYLPSIASSY